MEHYICRTVTELPGYMQANFRVPEGTQVYAGEIYMAKTLDTDLGYGNWSVYLPEVIEDVSKEVPAIVLNGGFETLNDGRRPDGNPDYTTYTFNPGDIVTAIRLEQGTKFEISYDAISNGIDVDGLGYLIPEEGVGSLKFVDTLNEVNSKVYLKVEALKHFRIGGQFGGQFINTMVVRVVYKKAEAQPVDPEITAIQAEVVQGLKVGDANVASGATVLTMNTVGGTQPYEYSLVPDGEVAQDNDKFVIGSAELKVGAEALTEAKTYKVYVQSKDSKGKIFKEGFDIPVAAE